MPSRLFALKIALAGTFVGRGGIQTHLQWLACALAGAGHELCILSFGQEPTAADRVRAEICREHDNVDVCFVARNGLRSGVGGRLINAARYLQELRPDIYIACGTGFNLFACALLSGACRKLIYHEVMSGSAGTWRDSRRLAAWFFHDVVAQAHPVAQNFRRTFRWSRDIAVLPAFPEPLEMTGTLPPLTERRVPIGKARAAFFGRLVPHKQPYWLIQRWSQLQHVLGELHFYGTGSEEELIGDFIRRNKLQERVTLHGAYPGGRAYTDLLSGFDMTLLPSIGEEGAPLVLLESMACGVPFVAFDVGGIGDYANADSVVCPAAQPESFVTGIRKLAERLNHSQIQREQLRKFYLQKFSFRLLQQRWAEYVEQMAAK